MRFVYNNLIDALASSAMTASSEIATYAIENIQDQKLTTKWFSDSTTTQTVVFNFGAATSITVMGILGHNIASTATVIVEANASDVWTAPSVTNTLTWDAGNILKFVSTQTYQYFRFKFTGLTTGLEIGRIWLGNYITASPSSTLDFTVTKRRSDITVYGRGRQKFSSEGVSWRKIELSFPQTQGTSLTNITTFIDAVGTHESFIFCNFDDLTSYELVKPMYCSISDNDVKFNHTDRQKYKWSITLEEDL